MAKGFAVLTTIALAIGCGTGPGDSDFTFYTFDLIASARDSTAERLRVYDCTVSGGFSVFLPVAPDSTVRFPVFITRSLTEHRGNHREFTTAESSVEAMLEYSGLGQESLQLTFRAGTYTATLPTGLPTPGYPGEYSGDWICGPDFPLAQDSTLNAYGYDPNLEIPGSWRIQEIQPIE